MKDNMIFEGRTEREAIEKAAIELGSESFDVEVIEKTGGIFGFGKVKIRVKALDSIPSHMGGSSDNESKAPKPKRKAKQENRERFEEKEKEEAPPRPIDQGHVRQTASFVEEVIRKMGLEASVSQTEVEGAKVRLEIDTRESSVVIGRKGKNLDSLQILANVYFHKMDDDNVFWRVILDSEGYRAQREDTLINQALRTADKVLRTQASCLLEPMNPFERHLIHRALSEREEIATHSEGEGYFKRIRVRTKNSGRKKSTRSRR